MASGWIELDKKAEGGPRVLRKVRFSFVVIAFNRLKFQVESIDDAVKEQLLSVLNGHSDALNDTQKADFKKRKLLVEVYVSKLFYCSYFLFFIYFRTVKSFVLKKGAAFTTSLSKPETDLTVDMLAK